MIISRTPFRISFFGGGTDYPGWIKEHGGAVLTTSINKYCYITCRWLPPFFEHKSRILYSKIEEVKDNRDIQHPAVRAVLEHLKIEDGIEIHHDGDLPARTGLGSSSSFAVGMLHACHALQHRMVDKLKLAHEAIHIEQELLKETVGCQDQVIAAVGGLNRIDFHPDGRILVQPMPITRSRRDELHDHLLLYFTGFSRIASEIAQEQVRNMKSRQSELKRMREMVDESIAILTGSGSLDGFGKLMDESWRLKRTLSSKVSNSTIDDFYEAARKEGALGGKLLGAGGGGFMLLFAKPEVHERLRDKFSRFMRIPFHFESDGSQVILYQPDELHEDGSRRFR